MEMRIEMIEPRDYVVPAQRAADKASRLHEGWQDRASELFLQVLRENGTPMLCEQVVAVIEGTTDLPEPPDSRAWGAVTRSLACKRLIRRFRYAPCHDGSVKTEWLAN